MASGAEVEAHDAIGLILDFIGVGLVQTLDDAPDLFTMVRVAVVPVVFDGACCGERFHLYDEPLGIVWSQRNPALIAFKSDHQANAPISAVLQAAAMVAGILVR